LHIFKEIINLLKDFNRIKLDFFALKSIWSRIREII